MSLPGEAEWVRNVRAARHEATIRRGRARKVRLEEVSVEERAPILEAYLSKRAFSKSSAYEAREFFGVPPNASLDELRAMPDRYPVFRIVVKSSAGRLPTVDRGAGPGRSAREFSLPPCPPVAENEEVAASNPGIP